MAPASLAYIFPAFINDYKDDPSGSIPEFSIHFTSLLEQAASFDPVLRAFDPATNPMTEDELRNQYLTYIYSYAVFELLSKRGVKAFMHAGYSMGIYAALAAAGSITFSDGLLLIREAFLAGKFATGSEGPFGMAMVIGLNEQDLQLILAAKFPELNIVNNNSEVSFVVSGNGKSLPGFLEAVKQEGALHARQLNASLPFHTRYMHGAVVPFKAILDRITIQPPEVPLISMISQRALFFPDDLKAELLNNLHTPFSWYKTQQHLEMAGMRVLTELGPSSALKRNARFTSGNIRFSLWPELL